MKKAVLAAIAGIALCAPAFASDPAGTSTRDDALKVEPGNSPTEAMTQEVPAMQGKSDKEHAATNRMDETVPPMKPGDEAKSDPDNGSSSTN